MTKSYGGRSLSKSIRVYTNDPDNREITLKMSGDIKKFVTIRPSKIFLKGVKGEKIVRTVSVIPGENESFKVLEVNTLRGNDFNVSLKEKEIEGKPAYELTVENTRQTPGRFFDKIFIVTDRTDQVPITIIVTGDIDEPEKFDSEHDDTGTASGSDDTP